ncbi:MAG TPA: GlsB/YeaQ/YmgE family stress response membrane protein [Candidatus Binataceae bacterium]|nr:GlsB/YeaQ/YmgE family stress response membrane protein [Candidatus Binataceae bacterium]
MGAVFWLVVGAMAGFVASKLIYKNSGQLMRDVLLGAFGALAAGVLYREMGFHNLHQLNPGSIIVAVAGAFILLSVYRMLGGRPTAEA